MSIYRGLNRYYYSDYDNSDTERTHPWVAISVGLTLGLFFIGLATGVF